MRQGCRRYNGRIGDVDAVVNFITLFQTTQNGNGIFHAGLVDQNFLKTPLKGRISWREIVGD